MAVVWPNELSQYPSDYDLPLVDHIHDRHRGTHWPFVRSHKLEQETFYPDIDMRDCDTSYAIDIELPGIGTGNDVKVEWTSKRDIIVTGTLPRPDVPKPAPYQPPENSEPVRSAESTGKDADPTPTLLVGERKTGKFHRRFHLPVEVNTANIKAKLENGLLMIRVDKEEADEQASGQVLVS